MSLYSFSEQAVQDLDEICSYLAKDNPKTASRLFDAITQSCLIMRRRSAGVIL